MPSSVCVIPARGGSKRIPRKNIRIFRGKPMIAWSIQAAIASHLFDQVLVSTDDPEIASIAQSYGAAVPFLRSASLADDFTGTSDVIVHAIKTFLHASEESQLVCCLYATAPFVRPQDLEAGYRCYIEQSGKQPVFSATSYAFPVQRAFMINNVGCAEMLQPSYYNTRSQDLPEVYHDAGQFYWADMPQWLSKPTFSQGCVPLILPRWRVQDIDSEEDWHHAELLHKLLDERC